VVSPDGREAASLTVLRSGDRIEIRRRGARKPWTVCLRNVGPARSVEGAEARVTPEGIQLLPARGAEVVVVKV